jgi:hypothetical protein
MKSNIPNGGVDQLAHDRCAILEDIVENLCFGDKTPSTRPLSVAWFKFSKHFRCLISGRDGVECWSSRIDGCGGSVPKFIKKETIALHVDLREKRREHGG